MAAYAQDMIGLRLRLFLEVIGCLIPLGCISTNEITLPGAARETFFFPSVHTSKKWRQMCLGGCHIDIEATRKHS